MTDEMANQQQRDRDWRLHVSLGLTFVWLLLGFLYISSVVGWMPFLNQGAPSLGGFLEGAFAPLAFLWLVMGFFLQQKQLTENTATIQMQLVEMRRTAQHAETQARAIQADELHSRQDTFTRVTGLVYDQLGVIAGYLVTSYESGRIETEGPEVMDAVMDLWGQLGRGDPGVFDRYLTRMCFSGSGDPAEIFWGTEVRSGHSARFAHAFERLLRNASKCDPDGMIEDAIRDGVHGRVYRFIDESRPGRPAAE